MERASATVRALLFTVLALRVMCLFFWAMWHYVLPWGYRMGDLILAPMERRGPLVVIAFIVPCYTFVVIMGLINSYKKANAFKVSREHPTYWLKTTIGFLVSIAIGQSSIYLFWKWNNPEYIRRHDLFIEIGFRTFFVILMVAIGFTLYLFKRNSKMLYGLSEIILAILSNVALIGRVNFVNFPRVNISVTDLVAVVLFTYLLSRGVSNLAEGVQERLQKRKDDVLVAPVQESSLVSSSTTDSV